MEEHPWLAPKERSRYLRDPARYGVHPFSRLSGGAPCQDELKAIFADSRAHRDWQAALKANAGIYRIVDLSDGKIYIGSAYGSGGLWARWQTYAKTGHGGNKLLKERDPQNFQWSIVRTLSTTMSPRDVIRIEAREKAKHGSRAIGLNGN